MRPIDADKVMEEISRIGGHNLCEWETIGVKALICRQDTLDVVPREEVDRLCHSLNSYALQYGTVKDQHAVIERIKADTAKTIFAEIESLAMSKLDANLSVAKLDDTYYIQAIDDLKEKYSTAPPQTS